LAAIRVAALGAVLTGGLGSAPKAVAAGSCTQTWRYFHVSHLDLHETITSHFVDTDETQATIDTVQQANVSEHVPNPAASARRKSREIAFFYALQRGCRIGDYNLGFLNRTISVHSTLQGTWSTTGRSGSCDQSDTLKPTFNGTFMRPNRSRNFFPPPSKARLELSMTHHGRLDCRFEYIKPDGVSYATAGLGHYSLPSYRSQRIAVRASPLLHNIVVRIPFRFAGNGQGDWAHGTMTSTELATGTLTLSRYKSCTMTPRTPLTFLCLP
jgi:hypothetical protein